MGNTKFNGTLGIRSIVENGSDNLDKHKEHGMSVPGGIKEKPNNVPSDHAPSANKTEITADEYNKAVSDLQKSFKEFADVAAAIADLKIVDTNSFNESANNNAAAFLEVAMDNAFMEAYENGAFFEAVERKDKKEVKAIVAKLRSSLPNSLKEDNIKFYKTNMVGRLIWDIVTAPGKVISKPVKEISVNVNITSNNKGSSSFAAFLQQRLWQIVGVINIEEQNISTVLKRLNEEYKDELGEYKILALQVTKDLLDLFRTKLGWKNVKKSFFITVDRKLPTEIKELQNDVSGLLAKVKDMPEKDNKVKTESKNMEDEEMKTELYKEYLINFAESGVEGSPLSADEFMEAVETYEESGSLDSFTEGKYYQYKKMSKDAGNEEPASRKDFKANFNKVKNDIDRVYDSMKDVAKKSDSKVKVPSKYKFRGAVMALADLSEEDLKDNTIKNKITEALGGSINIPTAVVTKVKKLIHGGFSEADANALGKSIGEALSSAFGESSEVIEHLGDFLKENV